MGDLDRQPLNDAEPLQDREDTRAPTVMAPRPRQVPGVPRRDGALRYQVQGRPEDEHPLPGPEEDSPASGMHREKQGTDLNSDGDSAHGSSEDAGSSDPDPATSAESRPTTPDSRSSSSEEPGPPEIPSAPWGRLPKLEQDLGDVTKGMANLGGNSIKWLLEYPGEPWAPTPVEGEDVPGVYVICECNDCIQKREEEYQEWGEQTDPIEFQEAQV